MEVYSEIKFNNTACAVEYNHLLNIYAVGTYELVDTQTDKDGKVSHQQRKGECVVYDCTSRTFAQLDSRQTPGTLDIKWMNEYLGIVDAEGILSIDKYDNGALLPACSINCKSQTPSLALSLDWSNLRRDVEPHIAVSLSDGRAITVNTSTEQVVHDWQAHDYETWIAAWDHYSPNHIVYTGADDCVFKSWDLRSGTGAPVSSNKRCVRVDVQHFSSDADYRFDGGVTTISNSPHNDYELAVGSYDETLRMFDKRNLKTPTSSITTSGGIWRIKYHETNPNRLVMANMYGGFDVVDLPSNVVLHTNTHHNLGYGVDWNKEGLILSASFYDKKGLLWSV